MLREYVWLQGRPVAVIDAAADSQIYAVHVDHLDRPVTMTNYAGAVVWQADYLPFGEVRASAGPASLASRFPGQWFMLETGLHYNWRRWYDASTGRYTQPDPVGMPDGPSRYAYAANSPLVHVDPDGLGILGDLFGGSSDDSTPDACFIPPDFDPDECERLRDQIRSRVEELKFRYTDMLVDAHGLFQRPLPGIGSWPGHVQQFEDKRRNLRKLIDEATNRGCAVPPEAFMWLIRPAPSKPLGLR